jgi:hypothetical protein
MGSGRRRLDWRRGAGRSRCVGRRQTKGNQRCEADAADAALGVARKRTARAVRAKALFVERLLVGGAFDRCHVPESAFSPGAVNCVAGCAVERSIALIDREPFNICLNGASTR